MATELIDTSIGAVVDAADHEVDADRVEWLVDNADAYREILRAIARAHRSIWISQLALDVDCQVYNAEGNNELSAYRDVLLLDALLAASRRGVAVRILLNETLLVDTAKPLRAALRRAGDANMRVRGVKQFPQLLHAKMLIVDEREALLLGSPFVNGYWDDAAHQPRDVRRPTRELGGRPLHDLSVRITGQAVHALGAIFAELWNDLSVGSGTDAPIEHRPLRARNDAARIAIARTAPRGALHLHPEGTTEIMDAVEEGLESARRLIYIEHQYLSSRRVIAALVEALARAPALEIVIVLNQNPDVTAYRGWQNARLGEAGLFAHPRVGMFALWRVTPSRADAEGWAINQVFVHSKVLIVDDEWLSVGSANLDGVSLHSYGHDFTGWLGRRLFRDVCNFDVNAVIRADRDAEDNSVRALRQQLWCEHLAILPNQLATRPTDGWLALWRARARAGVNVLGSRPALGLRTPAAVAIVLPYSTSAAPAGQLRDVGVPAVEHLDLRFNPGWLEVHFSPNWVRNMFV